MRTAKKVIIYALVIIILGAAATGGYLFLKKDYDKKISAATEELENYKLIYEPLGEIYAGYAVAEDKNYGEMIKEEDLIAVDIPENSSANVITDIEEIVGKYYRVNITEGSIVLQDLVMDFPQTADERAYDVITKVNPIGLEPNDFVDIRFLMPGGEDYIALSHKRVEGIYGGVLKLIMSEFDIMVYNSLVVDQILFKGSIIYATKYVEPGGQNAAIENYPISTEIIDILVQNPNIRSSSSSRKGKPLETMSSERAELEKAYEEYAADELRKSLIESGKSELPSRIQSGESEYRTQKEIEEQKRLEEAIMNGGQ